MADDPDAIPTPIPDFTADESELYSDVDCLYPQHIVSITLYPNHSVYIDN